MKKNTRSVIAIAMIAFLVVALATWLITQFTVSESLIFAPVLFLPIIFFMGMGLFALVYGLIISRTLLDLFGGVSLVLGLAILLLCLKMEAWIVGVLSFVLLLILGIFVIFTKVPQTELVFDNNKVEKTYEERQKEHNAMRDEEKEKPLPEIKSFKD